MAVNRCRRPDYGGTADAEEVKDGFLAASRREIIAEAGGAQPLVGVFTGKGSPEDFATMLSLVYSYKAAFLKLYAKATGVRGACARLLARHDGRPREMLQAFCDAYLGLDCNGFVGNFARRVAPKSPGPSHLPSAYYHARKARRTKREDVELFDVIVWANFTHVAIIDSFLDVPDGHASIRVAQSTAGGPQVSDHDLVPVGGGQFRLAPAGKVGGSVYVISLGLNEAA